jgi:hypothetical protein
VAGARTGGATARRRGGGGNTRQTRDAGAATKGDQRRLKAQATEADRLRQDAYEAGRAGTPYDESIFGSVEGAQDAYTVGVDEARGERRQQSRDQLAGAGRRVAGLRGPDWVNQGAGFVLGMLVYALALNYVQGGPDQARGWLAAKFLNKPYRAHKATGPSRGGPRR